MMDCGFVRLERVIVVMKRPKDSSPVVFHLTPYAQRPPYLCLLLTGSGICSEVPPLAISTGIAHHVIYLHCQWRYIVKSSDIIPSNEMVKCREVQIHLKWDIISFGCTLELQIHFAWTNYSIFFLVFEEK